MYSIFVRAFEPEDILLINKWRNDPDIQKLTGGIVRKVSSEMEKEWVRDKMMNNYRDIYWAICLNDDTKRMIGYTSINEIDYIYRSAFSGGTVIGIKEFHDGTSLFETMLIKLDYVFNTLNLYRFHSRCLPDHRVAPIQLAAFGFEQEGRLRQAVYKNGKYYDLLCYSLLREEYYNYIQSGEYEISRIIQRFRQISKKNNTPK